MAKTKNKTQNGGVQISGGSVQVGGDIVGGSKTTVGDTIRVGDIGAGAAVAIGREASVSTSQGPDLAAELARWRVEMEAKIDALCDLSSDEKLDAKDQVAKIEKEAARAERADPQRLEKLINTLGIMASDIFEVALTTLANPLAGIGLVAKKIGEKAKLERETQG